MPTTRAAFARVGVSERGDAMGVVATLRTDAPIPVAIRAGLSLSLIFTDAGISQHCAISAAFDLCYDT